MDFVNLRVQYRVASCLQNAVIPVRRGDLRVESVGGRPLMENGHSCTVHFDNGEVLAVAWSCHAGVECACWTSAPGAPGFSDCLAKPHGHLGDIAGSKGEFRAGSPWVNGGHENQHYHVAVVCGRVLV